MVSHGAHIQARRDGIFSGINELLGVLAGGMRDFRVSNRDDKQPRSR